jgi:hypothetical protein
MEPTPCCGNRGATRDGPDGVILPLLLLLLLVLGIAGIGGGDARPAVSTGTVVLPPPPPPLVNDVDVGVVAIGVLDDGVVTGEGDGEEDVRRMDGVTGKALDLMV